MLASSDIVINREVAKSLVGKPERGDVRVEHDARLGGGP
jgi:hypothetical protein